MVVIAVDALPYLSDVETIFIAAAEIGGQQVVLHWRTPEVDWVFLEPHVGLHDFHSESWVENC